MAVVAVTVVLAYVLEVVLLAVPFTETILRQV